MPRLNPIDRKTALLKKQEQIAQQLKQLTAREKEGQRKADTRRKVIAGALALSSSVPLRGSYTPPTIDQ
jgi:hypothetical protein